MDIDLCNLAKKLADGAISEDEFIHQRTKIIYYISQGKSNKVKSSAEEYSLNNTLAENDDIFHVLPETRRTNGRNSLRLFILIPVVLLIGMALTLLFTDTPSFKHMPVKYPETQNKDQQLPVAEYQPPKSTNNGTKVAHSNNPETIIDRPKTSTKADSSANKKPGKSALMDGESSAHLKNKPKTPPAQIRAKSNVTTQIVKPNQTVNTVFREVPVTSVALPTTKTRIKSKDSSPPNISTTTNGNELSAESPEATPELPQNNPVNNIVKSKSPGPKPTMAEIQQLLIQFVDAYESGDLESFTSLFAKNAKTNDQKDRSGIRAEYQQLFNGTQDRQMHFTNFDWDLYSGEAEGKGHFELLISPKNATNIQKYRGEVQLILKQENDKAVISEMRHTEKSDS